MALTKKDEKRVSSRVFSCLSLIVGVVLLIVGLISWNVGMSVESEVKKNLIAEKVYFPPKDSPMFAPAAFPDAQKYAGMQVDDGTKAKAYAQDYLAVQSKMLSNGKTSSEVAAMLMADPQNEELQKMQGIKFQLEMTKGQLLTTYGVATQAKMMQMVGMVALLGGVALLVISLLQYARYRRLQ